MHKSYPKVCMWKISKSFWKRKRQKAKRSKIDKEILWIVERCMRMFRKEMLQNCYDFRGFLRLHKWIPPELSAYQGAHSFLSRGLQVLASLGKYWAYLGTLNQKLYIQVLPWCETCPWLPSRDIHSQRTWLDKATLAYN